MGEKIELDLNKWSWHPSPLVSQVVLVTTVSEKGVEKVAPKSLISMFSFDPPILGVGCNMEHMTARNIISTGEFTVNVPPHTLAQTIWRASELSHPRKIKDIGLTSLQGLKVRSPRIEECLAHFECTLDSIKTWEKEIALFGRIITYSRDTDIGETWKEWYSKLGLFVYLEERLYGIVKPRNLDEESNL